jgi:hypothetical protein
MLVSEFTVVMSRCGVMFGVLMFTVPVMMSRLVVMVSCRMMVQGGLLMMFVRGMFSHVDISMMLDRK